MRELPILFNTEMVKVILDGKKTQTRRIVKPQPITDDCGNIHYKGFNFGQTIAGVPHFENMIKGKAPYQVGDRLYVREKTRLISFTDKRIFSKNDPARFRYEADQSETELKVWPDRIKMFMTGDCCSNGCFKELARIWLEVTAVRVERVQDITSLDVLAEGIVDENSDKQIVCGIRTHDSKTIMAKFQNLWDSIYKNWDVNPWVFVTEFERIEVGK